MVGGHVYHMGAEEILDRLMPPAGWVPTAEQKHAYQLGRCRRAFEVGGVMGSYVWTPAHDLVDPGDAVDRQYDPGVIHAEYTSTIAGWDLPGVFPYLPYEEQPFHLPHVTVARTACLAEDLGKPDDTGHRPCDDTHGGYRCRLGHLHRGRSPYGTALPPDVSRTIAASLGEAP